MGAEGEAQVPQQSHLKNTAGVSVEMLKMQVLQPLAWVVSVCALTALAVALFEGLQWGAPMPYGPTTHVRVTLDKKCCM